jgi:hypothetical protein
MLETQSVDHDVMLHVQGILRDRYAIGVNLHARPPRQAGYQPQHHLACYGDAARAVMADVAALMGERRSQRIAELLGPAEQPRLIREAGPCYDVRRAA